MHFSNTPLSAAALRPEAAESAMAAALGNHRAPASRAIGFLLRSWDALRSFSAVPVPAAPSPNAEDATKPNRKKKKTLFEVAQFLPDWGIGYKMAKTHWRDVSYEITKINLYKDGRHGKAWGIRYKAGLPASDAPVKLSGVNKRGWKYIPQSKKVKSAPKVEE